MVSYRKQILKMKFRTKIILGIFIGLTITLYWISTITEGEYYKSYSPDGQYSIYASRSKYFNLKLPFVKFGDAGGKVHLYDELENRLITSCSVEMISHVDDHFFWSEDELYMKASIYIKLPRKINAKIIREYDRSYPVKNTWNLFLQGKQYTVIKKGNRLTVTNGKGDVILKKIKHISRISNGFQVLNDTTEIEYYDEELNKLKEAIDIKINSQEVCGNVTTYGLKIEEVEEYFILKKAIGFTSYNFDNYKVIDSLKKENIKDIYFLNKKRTLQYDENSPKKESMIIDFGTYFGILSKKYGIEYFDSVDITQWPIKVKRNKLYGYYDITSIRYLELKPFEFNLAEFKHEEYGEGYVDVNGEEYYK